MDWIKLTVRHTEYLLADASDSVYRSYVRVQLMVASMEVPPNKEQISFHLGKRKFTNLLAYLKMKNISLDLIIEKVMEDVSSVIHKREMGKKRQDKHRGNTVSNALPNAPVTGADKIREDKIKEDKNKRGVFSKPSLTDLVTYIKEHKYQVDAETFLAFYESKGWVVGKSPMKDWKAALRGWHTRNKGEDKATPLRAFGGVKK